MFVRKLEEYQRLLKKGLSAGASTRIARLKEVSPLRDGDHDACALSWVRESHADLDEPLWRTVSEWLEADWPFATGEYAPRA
jgi:hypothetical protein